MTFAFLLGDHDDMDQHDGLLYKTEGTDFVRLGRSRVQWKELQNVRKDGVVSSMINLDVQPNGAKILTSFFFGIDIYCGRGKISPAGCVHLVIRLILRSSQIREWRLAWRIAE